MNFADKVNTFNKTLKLDRPLPSGIKVMNPYVENPEALRISSEFYTKFFDDLTERRIILGINPGRFGAGVTGIPFTDTRQLKDRCGINFDRVSTYELSSTFIYDMIEAYGGVELFYSDFYIGAVCPLGFLTESTAGKVKNYNYYDSMDLLSQVESFIIESLDKQLKFGINTDVCFCLGNNKNFKYLQKLNKQKNYFGEIVPLEHPRYIMQYKLKQKNVFIDKYIHSLRKASNR